MLTAIERKRVLRSASPSARFGHSAAPDHEPKRARLYLGGLHSPFAYAHRLCGEWREWRELLEFNQVEDPWHPEGEQGLDVQFLSEEARSTIPVDIYPNEQPFSSTFPSRIRLEAVPDAEENTLTIWAYDAQHSPNELGNGVVVDLEAVDTIELAPVRLRMQPNGCVLFALGAGFSFDVSITPGERREFLISPL